MKLLANMLSVIFAAGMFLAFLKFTQNASAGLLAPDALSASEMALNPTGDAYEISLDASGNLWVSDYSAGELWKVSPAGNTYSVYPVSGTPSDAHADSSGKIWWANTFNSQISRLSPTLNVVETWDVPGSAQLYGLQVESTEKIWVNDAGFPYIYQLNLSTNQLCTYTISLDWTSGYILYQNGEVWAGDSDYGRIYRLSPALNQLTYWQLPAGSEPEGLAFDSSGNVWWSNYNVGILDRLTVTPAPATDLLSRFSLPRGTAPEMIAWDGSYMWYGETSQTAVGRLDPQGASKTDVPLTPQTAPITPQCEPIKASEPVGVSPTTDTISFTNSTYPVLYNAGGWAIYRLPNLAVPWGLVYREDDLWLVDTGRQVLIKFSKVPVNEISVYLPLVVK
jgi:streptogramin lyase